MDLTFTEISVVAILVAIVCTAMTGCRPNVSAGPLVIVASGDTAGWIVPCGCTTNQSGGLARRATCLAEMRSKAEIVPVEVGGAVRGTSLYDRAKLEAVLSGEILMGVVAHNLGAAEARFGPDELRRLTEKLGVPFLSANLRDSSGRLIAEPVRIISAAGRRLALIGVLSERYATPQIQVSSPRQAVLDAIHNASGKYDSVIVLAYLPEEELRQLADALPEADAVIGGPTGQPINPKLVGPVLLTSATHEGKFLALLDAPSAGSTERWSGRIVELTEKYANDPEQKANVERFRKTLAERDFTPEQTGFAKNLPVDMPKDYAVAGSDSCRKCHKKDYAAWANSTHSNAWKSLADKGAHVDPDCQRCHTTGYGLSGGFSSVKNKGRLTDVGCESCHGPSLAHVVEPKIRTPYFAQAKNHCTTCHDRENSPKFDYDKYWEKIAHGVKQSEEDDQ